jgi:cytochrome P450
MKLADQELNPLQWLNFVRNLMEWKNGKKMDAYIEREIEKRFEFYQQKTDHSKGEFESIIDLTLQEYMADPARGSTPKLDKEFIILARRNIRMLLFVGHDSTGSTITYCRYLLYRNPKTLARLRAEHDTILGTDLTQAPSKISNDPHLLNQLPYTTAVIKEALRLFPPAASIRQGVEGVDLIDEEGNHYPTANCMVYILHPAIQRDPANFVRSREFLPERWLVGPEDPLYPNVKGAWCPFEYGPRNFIGQLQVMVEVKAVLALTVREFDIKPAYEEWDAKNPRKGLRTVDGNRAYQVDEGAAHPSDHFPCRVYMRNQK